jgi:murein L,D-transpeptidase YcbB/YkuD
VPLSIQRKELVPEIQRDRSYLGKHDYEVITPKGAVVTGGTVSDEVLAQLRAGRLLLRQRPGPNNSLGLVKFMFPNQHNVYLHDTPARALFGKARRDFSHGCMRVERAEDLAVWVLRDEPDWPRERIVAAMNGVETIQVNLKRPIPVLIVYGTAVVLENGEVRFFDDVYGYDAALDKQLTSGVGGQHPRE